MVAWPLLAQGGSTVVGAHLNLLDEIHAIDHSPKNDVPSIQPACDNSGDEELGSIGVCARIGHREDAWRVMLQGKVLVLQRKQMSAWRQSCQAKQAGMNMSMCTVAFQQQLSCTLE